MIKLYNILVFIFIFIFCLDIAVITINLYEISNERIKFCLERGYEGVEYINSHYVCFNKIYNNDGTFNYKYSGFIE